MLIKYSPAKLLVDQLVANTLDEKPVNLSPGTERKLFGTENPNNQYKNAKITYAPIFVAGLQVNVTAERVQRAHHLASNPTGYVRFYLTNENGQDITGGQVVNNKNVDTFFRYLHSERVLTASPRPASPAN